MQKNLPALLWNQDQLDNLKGTFLFDRINQDLESMLKYQEEFHLEFPDMKVKNKLQEFFLRKN